MTLPDNLPQALTEARQRAGLTQTAAGQMVGAALRSWQHWEMGSRPIPFAALELWLVAAVAEGRLPPDDKLVLRVVRASLQVAKSQPDRS